MGARKSVVSAQWVGLGNFLVLGRFGGSTSPLRRLSNGLVTAQWLAGRMDGAGKLGLILGGNGGIF